MPSINYSLPHRDDCVCKCHRMLVDDAECGSPPGGGSRCCYPGPRRPPCDGCGKVLALAPLEGLQLCRACRRAVR